MRKFITSIIAGILLAPSFSYSQTATDFNVKDCSGISHHLFDELDAGKIIVISFVMPCDACIGPTESAQTILESYASTYPDRMVLYIADDDANTSCTSLSSWANSSGFTWVTRFSDIAVTQEAYGAGGMPKVVVLGGTDHKVYFSQNGPLNKAQFTNAVNAALGITGVKESGKADFKLSVYPNPVVDKFSFRYILPQSGEVHTEVYSLVGKEVMHTQPEKQSAGAHESTLNIESLRNGIYFLKLTTGEVSQVMKFTVSK